MEPRRSRSAPRRALTLILVHVLVLAHLVHWWLAGETLTPLEPSEAVATLTTGVVNAGFLLLLVAILSTLLFGRFFCGWACHVVAYQDACAWLLARFGWRPKPVRSRLLVLVPWFAAVDMFLLPPLSRWWSDGRPSTLGWHLTTGDFWERFPGPWMALTTFLVCGGLVVWFLGAKGFCTYACPYGALFGLTDRFAKGRIRVNDACEGCGHCTAVCTSNVSVKEEVQRFGRVVDAGCMKCLDCVSVCPKDALAFGFTERRREASPTTAAAAASTRHFDFSWPEELGMAAVFAVSVYAFRGLYGHIPFLLALALALLAAGLAVVLVRLLRGRDLRLQHVVLRAGRVTGAGTLFFVMGLAFLTLSAHSALVQYHTREGARLLDAAGQAAPTSAVRTEHLERSVEHLLRAEHLGLLPAHAVHDRLGQILVHLGRADEAERHLRLAIETLPESSAARVFLIQLLIGRGDWDAAVERLGELHALDPTDGFVASTLERILQVVPDHRAARELAADLADA